MMTYAVNHITFAIVSLTIFPNAITSGSKNYDLSLDDYFASIPDNNVRNLTRLLFSICPDYNVCGSMAKTSFNDTFGCCDASCSCDMDCHSTHSCCPHIWHTLTKSNVTEKIVHYKCQRAVILNRLDSGVGEEYFFVTSCPPNYDLVVKEACERRVHNETFAFGDVTPVSVQSDGANVRNYLNRHCAACNHVAREIMVLWSPHIFCRFEDYMKAESQSLEDRILDHRDCQVAFDPPKELDTNSTRCSSDVVSSCNVTGRWATYDEELESACKQYPLRHKVRQLSALHVRTYANVFCAICNVEPVRRDLLVTPCLGLETSNFINLLVAVSLPDADEESRCKATELYDPITDECQKLHCTKPLRLVPHQHSCKNVVEYVNIARFTIPLKISIPTNASLYLNSADLIRNQLWLLFWDVSKLINFTICELKFYFKLDRDYHMSFLLYSSGIFPYISTPIKEIFVTVYGDSQYFKPSVDYQKLVTGLTRSYLDIHGTRFDVSFGHYDANIQSKPIRTGSRYHTWTPISWLLWDDKRISSNLTIYQDVYDRMAVVGGLGYPLGSYCDEFPFFYEIGYMNCTGFMYGLLENEIERVPEGLTVRGKHFAFGQFQSVNESHVLICVDGVETNFPSSKGCRHCTPETIALTCLAGIAISLQTHYFDMR